MKKILSLLAFSGCMAGSFAQSKAEDVQSFVLDNAMKVLVLEDHSIPNANMYLFWRVGSRNEYPGITGLSHFFEHMMFNGAKKYGPKEFDRVMEAAGGSNNAYTSNDVTVYTNWFPASAIETIFDLEADRIASLAIDPAMVESERGVVLSERSTGLENNKEQKLMEQMSGAAFFAHPYHWPVIGYESDIKVLHEGGRESSFRIWMNNPLRDSGYVAYQTNYDHESPPGQEKYSDFTVVKNRSDQWPLYSLLVCTLGLVIHFGIKLLRFFNRSSVAGAASTIPS